jgi:hypothetical protein
MTMIFLALTLPGRPKTEKRAEEKMSEVMESGQVVVEDGVS